MSNELTNDELFLQLLDLSMTDLFIIQHLMIYSGEVLRFKVLQDINIKLPTFKQFTPAKFYYALNKLEEQGLISLTDAKKKGSAKIILTEKCRSLLQVFLLNVVNNSTDYSRVMADLIGAYSEKTGLVAGGTNLVVMEEGEKIIQPQKLEAFTKFSDKLYLLIDDEKYNQYRDRVSGSRVNQTRSDGFHIREANDYFHIVVVLELVENLTTNQIDEYFRVLQPGGRLIMARIKPIPTTNHFLIDHTFHPLQDGLNKFTKLIDQTHRLLHHRFDNLHDFGHQGFHLVWGQKKEA